VGVWLIKQTTVNQPVQRGQPQWAENHRNCKQQFGQLPPNTVTQFFCHVVHTRTSVAKYYKWPKSINAAQLEATATRLHKVGYWQPAVRDCDHLWPSTFLPPFSFIKNDMTKKSFLTNISNATSRWSFTSYRLSSAGSKRIVNVPTRCIRVLVLCVQDTTIIHAVTLTTLQIHLTVNYDSTSILI